MPLIPCVQGGFGLGFLPLRIRCRIRKAIGLAVEPTCGAALGPGGTSTSDAVLGNYRLAR